MHETDMRSLGIADGEIVDLVGGFGGSRAPRPSTQRFGAAGLVALANYSQLSYMRKGSPRKREFRCWAVRVQSFATRVRAASFETNAKGALLGMRVLPHAEPVQSRQGERRRRAQSCAHASASPRLAACLAQALARRSVRHDQNAPHRPAVEEAHCVLRPGLSRRRRLYGSRQLG